MAGFADMKGEVQEELEQLEKHLSEMDELRNESISKIEAQKSELKRLSELDSVRAEHTRVLEEMKIAKTDIDERRLSIAFMDQTIANLDEQIAAIQAEHDRILGEIEIKKNRLLDKIKFYEELNAQIEKLVELLKNEESLFKLKLEDLQKQREGLKNSDLSGELLEQAIKELDAAIEKLYSEHEAIKTTLAIKLSGEMEESMRDEVLAEIDRKMEVRRSQEPEVIELPEHEVGGKLSAEPVYPKEAEEIPGEGSVIIENLDLIKRVLQGKGLVLTDSKHILNEEGVEISLNEIIKLQLVNITLLEEKGLKLTESNQILNSEGGILTLQDVLEMGLFRTDSGVLQKTQSETEIEESVSRKPTEILGEIGEEIETRVSEEESVIDIIQYLEDEYAEMEYEYEDQVIQEKEKEKIPIFKEASYGSCVCTLTSGVTIEEEELQEKLMEEKEEKGLFYGSFASQVSSAYSESSESSALSSGDVAYLKREFGKALSLGLAEVVQVQPIDPIHYLAHWLFKYRYNQEIEIVKQRDLEALLSERNRIEAQKTHDIIVSAAQDAIFDAWLRAEQMILDKELLLEDLENYEEEEMSELLNM